MATTKRKVTMRSVRLAADGTTITEQCEDYVPQAILADYVADARTRWQNVTVSDGFDSGPGGDDGDTDHGAHLKDITDAALQRAHEEHLASLPPEAFDDPDDSPSPVTMTVPDEEA